MYQIVRALLSEFVFAVGVDLVCGSVPVVLLDQSGMGRHDHHGQLQQLQP